MAQQLPAELIRPGQQSDLEIINEKEALKKWREADALYLKNAKTNDRTKALQLWEEIAQIPPSETSPFLNQLIINSALNTGRFDAARKALIASGRLPADSKVFQTENLQKLSWEEPPASSVVRIDEYISETSTTPAGSGTVISEDGWVLTAAHVVARLKKPVVVFSDGSAFVVQFVHPGKLRADLALIKIETKRPAYAKLSDAPPSLGDTVYSVGFPGGALFPIKSSGHLKKYTQYMGHNTVATTLSGFPGSSGGGVFNEKGEVVGVMNMVSYDTSENSDARTYVALWEEICRLSEAAKKTRPSPLSEREQWAEKSSIWTDNSQGEELFFRASILYASDPGKGLELLQEAYEEGSMKAAHNLGLLLFQKPGRSKDDEKKAYQYFSEASESVPDALFSRGYCKLEGLGTKKDPPAGMDDIMNAALKGHAGGQVTVANALLNGIGAPFDYKKAMILAEDAVNKGIKAAYEIKLLGLFSNIMSPGNERPPKEEIGKYFEAKNFAAANIPIEKANQFFEFCVLAQEKDVPISGFFLAICYLEGIGVDKDLSKGITKLEEQGNKGDVLAAFTLGKLYYPKEKKVLPEEFDKCLYWYEKAGEKGDFSAMLLYGVCEMAKREALKNQNNSANPSKMSERATSFLVQAASSPISQASFAQFILGLSYLRGDYLPKDLPKAVYYLEMAKKNGVTQAEAHLVEAKTELEKTR